MKNLLKIIALCTTMVSTTGIENIRAQKNIENHPESILKVNKNISRTRSIVLEIAREWYDKVAHYNFVLDFIRRDPTGWVTEIDFWRDSDHFNYNQPIGRTNQIIDGSEIVTAVDYLLGHLSLYRYDYPNYVENNLAHTMIDHDRGPVVNYINTIVRHRRSLISNNMGGRIEDVRIIDTENPQRLYHIRPTRIARYMNQQINSSGRIVNSFSMDQGAGTTPLYETRRIYDNQEYNDEQKMRTMNLYIRRSVDEGMPVIVFNTNSFEGLAGPNECVPQNVRIILGHNIPIDVNPLDAPSQIARFYVLDVNTGTTNWMRWEDLMPSFTDYNNIPDRNPINLPSADPTYFIGRELPVARQDVIVDVDDPNNPNDPNDPNDSEQLRYRKRKHGPEQEIDPKRSRDIEIGFTLPDVGVNTVTQLQHTYTSIVLNDIKIYDENKKRNITLVDSFDTKNITDGSAKWCTDWSSCLINWKDVKSDWFDVWTSTKTVKYSNATVVFLQYKIINNTDTTIYFDFETLGFKKKL